MELILKHAIRILVAPRKVIREVLDTESFPGLILLPFIIGLLATPSAALSLSPSFPNHTGLVWLVCAVLSVLGYWMYVHAYGIGYRWIGSWMKGQGTVKQIQLSLAWTQIPFIYIGLIFLPVHFIFRDVLYPDINVVGLITKPVTLETINQLTGQFSSAYYILNLALLVPCIYAYIVSLKLLGEAHGFSAWKAFMVKLIAVALHIPIFGGLFLIVLVGMVIALVMIGF